MVGRQRIAVDHQPIRYERGNGRKSGLHRKRSCQMPLLQIALDPGEHLRLKRVVGELRSRHVDDRAAPHGVVRKVIADYPGQRAEVLGVSLKDNRADGQGADHFDDCIGVECLIGRYHRVMTGQLQARRPDPVPLPVTYEQGPRSIVARLDGDGVTVRRPVHSFFAHRQGHAVIRCTHAGVHCFAAGPATGGGRFPWDCQDSARDPRSISRAKAAVGAKRS